MIETLTEREKETLRLMGRGHDAKSMARHLGLSVHTVNERLRAARRKLSVSSSREAARTLLEREGADPESFGYKEMGEAGRTDPGAQADAAIDQEAPARRRTAIAIGVAAMSILIAAAAALTLLPQSTTTETAPPSSAAPAQAEVVRFARDWLALVDAYRWGDSWRATGSQFRALNSEETWARVSREVREPLGAVVSRADLSYESVPAPPSGYEMVKFRTNFANRANVVETVTLAREDGAWRVVSVMID